MAEKIVKLNSNSGNVEVEIIIGNAHWGRYKLYLWDADGMNPNKIGEGLSTDNIPDKFPLKPLSKLNGKLLSWEVFIAAFGSNPGQSYSLTIKITQGGNSIPGGNITDSGAFGVENTTYRNDFVRFIVL